MLYRSSWVPARNELRSSEDFLRVVSNSTRVFFARFLSVDESEVVDSVFLPS